jgi:hypothetical protein
MTLIYPDPPSQIRELAYKALNMEMLRHPHEESPHGLRNRANAFGHVPDFQKVFLLAAAAIAEGKGLKSAKHVAWYDVVVLSGIGHGIEVAQREEGHTSTHVTRGADVDHQIAVLTSLAAQPPPEPIEVRVLRVPSIAAFSFWLCPKNRSEGRLVPVISSSAQLQSGKLYSPEEFFGAIRAIASRLTAPAPAQRKRKRAKLPPPREPAGIAVR